MFIAALFQILKLWKQFRCHTTDEWFKKIWFIYRYKYMSLYIKYTMDFYSVIGRMKLCHLQANGWNWNIC
jgi:hypothetical protein